MFLFFFQILRDIKQGLLQLGKEGIRGPMTAAGESNIEITVNVF